MTIEQIERISITEYNEWCAYFHYLEEQEKNAKISDSPNSIR
jgi:hypothetical protein